MSAITSAVSQVALVNEFEPETKTYITAAAVTAGQALYLNSSGKVAPAQANAVGTSYFVGLALRSTGAGQAVTVVQRGSIIGLDLSGIAYNGFAYLSATVAGGLDTAAAAGTGNVVVPIGRVLSMPDGSTLTKVLCVSVPLNNILAALP